MENNKALTELLNTIATVTGTDITNAEGRNAVRSVLVKILVDDQGIELTKAFDMVWGDGAFEGMKGQVYDALRAA